MVYASFEEAGRDERFDAVLDRLFVHAGEFAVSADLVGCCSSSGSVPDFRPVLPPVSAFVPPRRRVERLLRRSSCGFTSQSATYVQLPQLSQCSLS